MKKDNSPLMRKIGTCLCKWRQKLGLSQAKMAVKMGTDQRYVCHLESGRFDMRLSTFVALCERAGLAPWEVLKEASEK